MIANNRRDWKTNDERKENHFEGEGREIVEGEENLKPEQLCACSLNR